MYFAVIRVNEMYDPSFIYHLISSKDFHKKLHIFCEGGALRVIKVAALKSIKLNKKCKFVSDNMLNYSANSKVFILLKEII